MERASWPDRVRNEEVVKKQEEEKYHTINDGKES
jgi:hypothetical protein